MTKYELLSSSVRRNDYSLDSVVYVGDEINDILVFLKLKNTFCPSNASPLIRKHAHTVLQLRGGDGVFFETIYEILQETNVDIESLVTQYYMNSHLA